MIRRKNETRTEQRSNMRNGGGTVTIEHFFDEEELRASCRLCARLTLPPDAGIGLHPHENEDEIYIILKGIGNVSDGKTESTVGPGDAVLTGKGESHAIKNIGNEPLELIAVIMPYSKV